MQMKFPLAAHSPTPVEQASPKVVKSSSVSLSQSLSRPSQNSGIGVPATALHSTSEPSPLQTRFPPATHSPTPAEQASPKVVKVSSVSLSQSLSRPSQSSLTGVPATALHSTSEPSPLQTRFPPATHSPTPAEQASPRVVKSSSVSLSQSLSRPSQSSGPETSTSGQGSHLSPSPSSSRSSCKGLGSFGQLSMSSFTPSSSLSKDKTALPGSPSSAWISKSLIMSFVSDMAGRRSRLFPSDAAILMLLTFDQSAASSSYSMTSRTVLYASTRRTSSPELLMLRSPVAQAVYLLVSVTACPPAA